MSIDVGASQRIFTTLTWPMGVTLTSWSYLWRITPIYRREIAGPLEENLPPPLPEEVPHDDVQRLEDGSGPLFHRVYTVRIRDPELSAAELMARVKADPNCVAPSALARFRKVRGPAWSMQRGDEFLIHMPGPWDGPVRAMEVTTASFRFATLTGHLEAGQIEWRTLDRDRLLVFQIDSWARPGDRLSAVMHDRLLMAKEVQLHMWTSVLERVVRRSGGQLEGGIQIETWRVDPRAFAGAPG